MIHICEICQKAYEPEEIKGVRKLKEFNGYTVDLRLKQFRKVEYGLPSIDFIEFSSPEGQTILQEMHKSILN